jgi:hypothetical protein
MGGPYRLGILPQPHQQGRKVANPLLFALSHKSRAPAYVLRLTKQRSSVKFAAPEIDTTLVALESLSRCSITPRQVTEGSGVFNNFFYSPSVPRSSGPEPASYTSCFCIRQTCSNTMTRITRNHHSRRSQHKHLWRPLA